MWHHVIGPRGATKIAATQLTASYFLIIKQHTQIFTFSEVADYIFAAVKTICHNPCPSPQ